MGAYLEVSEGAGHKGPWLQVGLYSQGIGNLKDLGKVERYYILKRLATE